MKHENNITPLNPNVVPEDTPVAEQAIPVQPVLPISPAPIQQPLPTAQPENPFPSAASTPQAPAPPVPQPIPQPALSPIYPTPAPTYGANQAAALTQANQPVWKTTPPRSAESTLGFTSLFLSGGSVGLFLLLIFKSGLVNSETKAVIWLIAFIILSLCSLSFGLTSLHKKDKLDLWGLMGIIVATIVLINATVIGSYYLELKIAENKIKSQYNTSSPSYQDY